MFRRSSHAIFRKHLLTRLSAAVIFFGLVSLPAWSQTQDVTPPVLTALTMTPAAIDTTTAAATVNVDYSITDDLSGVSWGRICFVSPSQGQQVCATFTLTVPSCNATGSMAALFPQYSESGAWKVTVVYLFDAAGNERILTPADLEANGWPAEISVAGQQDNTPPNFATLSLAPPSISTILGPATVTVSYTAVDDLSGVSWGRICFASPSQSQQVCATFSMSTPARSTTGTMEASFAQFSEEGVWTVGSAYLYDAAGNQRYLTRADFAANGWPAQVTIAGPPDTTPPIFTALRLSPSSIDATAGPATVTIQYAAADEISGVSWGRICFQSPSAAQQVCAMFSAPAPTRAAAGAMNAVFPQFAETGIWQVSVGYLVDAAGNQRNLARADFLANGWPLQITVGPPDKTPPESTVALNPPSNGNGWNRSDVTVALQAIDNPAGSGVKQIAWSLAGAQFSSGSAAGPAAAVVISSQGVTTVRYFATDYAGNLESTRAFVVRIDKTAPPAVAVVLPLPNGRGWNKSDVMVSFLGLDLISGIESCQAHVNVSSEGAAQKFSGACSDRAGNTGSPATAVVNLDKTRPVFSGMPATGCTLGPPNGKMVQVASVSAADSISGIEPGSFHVTATSSEPARGRDPDIVVSSTPDGSFTVQLRAERSALDRSGRVYTISATASDVAGNIASSTATCVVPHDQGK